jgi:hypothetical protein
MDLKPKYETETIDKLFLELAHFTSAVTPREADLLSMALAFQEASKVVSERLNRAFEILEMDHDSAEFYEARAEFLKIREGAN